MPAAFISLDLTGILSVWLETLIYGVYTSLFFETMYVILKKNRTDTAPSKIFFWCIILMWITATGHVGINLYRLLKGYVYLEDTIGPAVYFGDLTRWENVLHEILNALTTWIGDFLVIYRCYIVWNNNIPIIIIPVCLLCLSVVSNAVALHYFVIIPEGSIFSPTLTAWMRTIYATAFTQNTMTTGLIAYKIWQQDRLSKGLVSHSLSLVPLIRIVVESASIYVLNVLILIILYEVESNGQYVAQEVIVPVCGIVFTLITVRLAMRTSPELMTTQRDGTRIKFGTFNGQDTTNGFTTTTDQSLGSSKARVHLDNRAFAASDDKGSMGEAEDNGSESKFDVPLEDMLRDTKQTSSALEAHHSGDV